MCLVIFGKIKFIISMDGMIRIVKVVFGNIIKEVFLDMVFNVKEGDYVFVYVGVVINVVNELEVKCIFFYLKCYGGLEDFIFEKVG